MYGQGCCPTMNDPPGPTKAHPLELEAVGETVYICATQDSGWQALGT